MRISLLCTDQKHPVNEYLQRWMSLNKDMHCIELVRRKCDLAGGDILFLISCAEIVQAVDRTSYGVTLVLHASDLPLGRGWSPHVWNIVEGAEVLTISLLEAEDKVDSGRIWKKQAIPVPKYALWNEINSLLFDAEIELMDFAVSKFGSVSPLCQSSDVEPTYYQRRTPEDSRIDCFKSIESQFDKIRVCDPSRYPAFFELHGKKFKLFLERFDD